MADASITVTDTCGRCYGHVDAFRRYETLNGGRCFQCHGDGTITVTITPEQQKAAIIDQKAEAKRILARVADYLAVELEDRTGASLTPVAYLLSGIKAVDASLYDRAVSRAMSYFSVRLHSAFRNELERYDAELTASN